MRSKRAWRARTWGDKATIIIVAALMSTSIAFLIVDWVTS